MKSELINIKEINMQINKTFKSLIPDLTVEEFQQLEQNCINEGIRDKIITWNGFIIDGHNRFQIAEKHNLKFETIAKDFENESEVCAWIIRNQFGRRNLSTYTRSVLALELEKFIRPIAKENIIRGALNSNEVGLQKSAKAVVPIDTREEISKVAKVSHDTIAKVKVIEQKATPETKERLHKGDITINRAYKDLKREIRKEEYEKQITDNPLPENKKYRVVYADPPWKYNDKLIEEYGGADKHYNTMSIEELCELPIPELTEENAVLFLWVTSPLLEDSFRIIKSWGFKYKTSFVWDKVKHNMGHYNSVRHEFLLVCTKGSCTPDNKKLFDSVVSVERSDKHSEKPKEFIEIIDTIYTMGNKIELFARDSNNGWDTWGNQL